MEQEKKRREGILDIRQALAKEVTQKSREVAGRLYSGYLRFENELGIGGDIGLIL